MFCTGYLFLGHVTTVSLFTSCYPNPKCVYFNDDVYLRVSFPISLACWLVTLIPSICYIKLKTSLARFLCQFLGLWGEYSRSIPSNDLQLLHVNLWQGLIDCCSSKLHSTPGLILAGVAGMMLLVSFYTFWYTFKSVYMIYINFGFCFHYKTWWCIWSHFFSSSLSNYGSYFNSSLQQSTDI